MTRERIKDFKEIVLPFFTNYLLKKNYENLGKSDAEEFEKDFSEIIELADKALEQQPCEDAISRQAAIDAVEHITSSMSVCVNTDECHGMKRMQRQAIIELANLPSAQPERTCVNCGKTINNGGWYADGRTRCPIEEHYALPKDGFCHLWEKRNVTDDDYPERREDEH